MTDIVKIFKCDSEKYIKLFKYTCTLVDTRK